MKKRATRRESREKMEKFRLGGELVKMIRHFFPDLLELLQQVSDPRHQSHITYGNHVLMMTRILSAIFYINSMRKTSAEFNSCTVIDNIGTLCQKDLRELPYWETINGFSIEHLFSKNCQAMKNHYYLIHIAHMISQIMDAWKNLWDGISLSQERKHRRMLESWKTDRLTGLLPCTRSAFQIRFE